MKEELTSSAFNLRSYSKVDLALLYLPHNSQITAVRKFNRWIQYSPILWNQLLTTGFTITTRQLTPLQVGMIVNYLGIP